MRRSGFVSLDASDLAANAVEFYEPAAELKDIDLRFSAAGPVLISGDPVLLAQALGNLIDNALKYAPKNGKIEVAVRKREDGAAEVSVTDNGPGIGAAEKSKVVERFYRGDASRGTPGVGLGLSLVQAVAKLHGSLLELLDQSPGLRVVLTIPADAVVGSAPRPSPSVEAPSNKVSGATLAHSPLP
jgi:signal transduction histidine kinase